MNENVLHLQMRNSKMVLDNIFVLQRQVHSLSCVSFHVLGYVLKLSRTIRTGEAILVSWVEYVTEQQISGFVKGTDPSIRGWKRTMNGKQFRIIT